MLELLQQFQSDWWLNDRQPLVLIQRNLDGQIFIGTMPCVHPVSVKFSTDLKKWLLVNTRTTPLLSNVKHLNMNSCDLDGVNAWTLIMWLIISPNVTKLSLRLKNIADIMQIGNELTDLVKTDESLRLVFYRIKTVNILPHQGQCDDMLRFDMFLIFADLFPRAFFPYL
ncbi:unnamed protein product [Rotaria sp. Silwood2]|nr:unnamed protein product [Rotaria sp. Silwood2]CAF2778339.1 unnamed protein product [Rotaria sp. Silwood2]CAF3040118.1 unnamed protein product [Rotaria sp. Silwood2]CAF3180901.1 unnamed protein product [Rotaria sp. Silwood2]CAF4108946.1 unnamed protein product [Rotaria sp. Silwood2]